MQYMWIITEYYLVFMTSDMSLRLSGLPDNCKIVCRTCRNKETYVSFQVLRRLIDNLLTIRGPCGVVVKATAFETGAADSNPARVTTQPRDNKKTFWSRHEEELAY